MGNPHLELHFDVNKTVLVDDKVQGIDPETACNQILYWSSWGTVDGDVWRWDGRAPTVDRYGPGTTLFGDFVDARPELDKRALKNGFTSPGYPGERLRVHYEMMLRALALSPADKAALEGVAWAEEVGLHRGVVRLLPSFFALLQWLSDERQDFALVFRTFGADLPEVAAELNAFCRGDHPSYPSARFDGTTAAPDLRLDLNNPERFGSMHRGGEAGTKGEPLCVALGVLDAPRGRDQPPYQNPLAFYAKRAGNLLDSRRAFHAHIRGGGTFAFRDDYSGWARAGFEGPAGKPMCVDTHDTQNVRVFFDDNVREDAANIVDLRDATSGDAIAFEDAIGRCLVRVDPYRAVTDERYFIDALSHCLRS